MRRTPVARVESPLRLSSGTRFQRRPDGARPQPARNSHETKSVWMTRPVWRIDATSSFTEKNSQPFERRHQSGRVEPVGLFFAAVHSVLLTLPKANGALGCYRLPNRPKSGDPQFQMRLRQNCE